MDEEHLLETNLDVIAQERVGPVIESFDGENGYESFQKQLNLLLLHHK